jgi:hypothetical protein
MDVRVSTDNLMLSITVKKYSSIILCNMRFCTIIVCFNSSFLSRQTHTPLQVSCIVTDKEQSDVYTVNCLHLSSIISQKLIQ